jgi:hypothetical protein
MSNGWKPHRPTTYDPIGQAVRDLSRPISGPPRMFPRPVTPSWYPPALPEQERSDFLRESRRIERDLWERLERRGGPGGYRPGTRVPPLRPTPHIPPQAPQGPSGPDIHFPMPTIEPWDVPYMPTIRRPRNRWPVELRMEGIWA